MAVIDRNVLRLGAYELVYAATPGRVAINEAVELAKRYGTNSPRSSLMEFWISYCICRASSVPRPTAWELEAELDARLGLRSA